METEKIPHYMKDHMLSDEKEFGEIKLRLDRLVEKAAENGEHLSYFNKNLELCLRSTEDLKGMLVEQNRAYQIDRDEFIKYRARTEEMVVSFEEAKVIKKSDDNRGNMVVKWSIRIGAIGIIGSSILWLFNFFEKIK